MREIIVSCFLFLFFINLSFAETVVKLKSGEVMKGELVEKTDEYVKLNMYGVNITYWIDEVESITTKEEAPSVQAQMSPAEVYRAYLSALENEDWQEMERYVARKNVEDVENSGDIEKAVRMLKAFRPKNVEILKEDINGDKATLKAKGEVFGGMSEGIIEFIYEDNDWRKTDARWKSKGERLNLASPNNFNVKQGTGVISGTIILPDVDETGNLYIHFCPSGQNISTPDPPRYYTIIDADKITSNIVPYRIENVPQGSYWGVAVWDIAEPFWEPSWGEGHCPGYAGDYAGGTVGELVISEGQELKGINFECKNYLRPIERD